jgi:outer membrane protein OmpU
MNKLTKVGCSAICGSLAAITSASAGEMTVTGGVDMSWVSLSNDVTGNPIGIGSNLTFKGSGELDNGWTVDLTVANLNASAYSTTAIDIGMGGLGKLNINQGNSGNGIDAFDDKMPTAWEEPWGGGLTTGIVLVSGVGTSQNVQYTTPTVFGTTLTVAAAEMGQTDINDKDSGGSKADHRGKGYDATININPSFGTEALAGLNLYLGGHNSETYTAGRNEVYEGVAGVIFDLGPVSLGYGRQGHVTGLNKTGSDADFYRNTHYGVAINLTDDLSVSYGSHESVKHYVNITTANTVRARVQSYQIAYTMGGASLRLAEFKGDNLSYTRHNDKDATVVSMALAF